MNFMLAFLKFPIKFDMLGLSVHPTEEYFANVPYRPMQAANGYFILSPNKDINLIITYQEIVFEFSYLYE